MSSLLMKNMLCFAIIILLGLEVNKTEVSNLYIFIYAVSKTLRVFEIPSDIDRVRSDLVSVKVPLA